MLEKILKQAGVAGTAARVYTKLIELGPSPARRLAEALSLPRPSIYDALKNLQAQNLVVEREEEGKKVFGVNDPKALSQNLEDKMNELKKTQETFDALLPKLMQEAHTIEPKIRFFNGKDGVWRMIREILWHKNKTMYGFWPIKNIINLLGADEFADFHKKREKKKIWIDVIWPHGSKTKESWLASNKEQQREIRIAPKGTTWDMGYWITDDKVFFVSPKNDLFGFVVQSQDFVDMMMAQWRVVWGISKKLGK